MEYDDFEKIYTEYIEVPAILRKKFTFEGYFDLRKRSTKADALKFLKIAKKADRKNRVS